MRGCLGFVLVVAAALVVGAILVVQVAVPALVTAAVEDSPIFAGRPISVTVSTSLGGLLGGRVDRIAVTASRLDVGVVTVATLDATVTDVWVLDRSFTSASGALDGVSIATAEGVSVRLARIALSGSGRLVTATGEVAADQLTTLLESRLRAAGLGVGQVRVASGSVRLVINGQALSATFRIADGGLVMDLGPGVGPIPILAAPADRAWQLTSFELTPTGARITAAVGD